MPSPERVQPPLGTDLVLITLDTLRYDVAVAEHAAGRLPVLGEHLLGDAGWEERHSPGSFTFAAHAAFFAGFLPTPAEPGGARAPRRFAMAFGGSETTGPETWVFDAPDLPSGLAAAGYHTICIGGTGFFNRETPLGEVLPGLFAEAHWEPALGVTDPRSTEHQVALACARLAAIDDAREADARRPVFLFLNVAALHQPNWFYLPTSEDGIDSLESHAAALRYVDAALAPLFASLRRPSFVIVTSDHGTAYGEDGHHGHRLGHSSVWTVPYAEGWLR